MRNLPEFGIDIRGTRMHSALSWVAVKLDRMAVRLNRWGGMLDCGCEACLREFLPWPLGWQGE